MSAAFSLYFYPCGLSGLAAVEQLHEACQGYDNWLRLAFALSDGLGEAGRQIFDRLSQMNADYDTRECNRLYDNCMKGNKGGITIATFFQMARDMANVDLKEMARERGKRVGIFSQNSHFPIFPSSHITKNKCNKKDNILIYNNLDKNTISRWEDGKMGKWENVVKTFPTAIHSPTSWIRQTYLPHSRKSCTTRRNGIAKRRNRSAKRRNRECKQLIG